MFLLQLYLVNIKLLRKLESGFEKTINWNKYSKKASQAQVRYLNFLIDQSY